MKKILFFLVLWAGYAQSQITDSLIAAALKNHPAIAAQQFAANAAAKRGAAAAFWDNPVLGIEFSQVEAGSLNLWNGALSNNLSLTQMIPLGGRMAKMAHAEAGSAVVKQYSADETRVRVAGMLRMALYKINGKLEEAAVQEAYVANLTAAATDAANRYRAGSGQLAEVYMAEAAAAEAAGALASMRAEYTALAEELRSLSGGIILLTAAGWHTELPPLSVSAATPVISPEHPSLLKMDAMAEMQRRELLANDAAKVPDLMAGAMIMRMPKGMVLTSSVNTHALSGALETEYMYSIMASITLPFAPWVSGKYARKEEELLAGISSTISEKEWMLKQMEGSAGKAALQIEQNRALYQNSTGTVLPRLSSAATAARNAFASGKGSFALLLEAEKMLQMQQMRQIMYKTDCLMAYAEYLMMTGKTFERELPQ